jgi:hypothetical protein
MKNLCKFAIILSCIILTMTNVSDGNCIENQKTYYVQKKSSLKIVAFMT